MAYFANLPQLRYYLAQSVSTGNLLPNNPGLVKNVDFGVSLTDITIRYKIRDAVLSDSTAFYPYTWQDTDTPDTVALNVYGDSKYWWIVFYSNGSFDFKFDFPLSARRFNDFLIRKYAATFFDTLVNPTQVNPNVPNINPSSVAAHPFTGTYTGSEWLSATEWQTILNATQSTVAYYKTPTGLIVDVNTFNSNQFPGTVPVTIYEDEFGKNEKKRVVRLLSPNLVLQMQNELENEVKVRRARGQ